MAMIKKSSKYGQKVESEVFRLNKFLVANNLQDYILVKNEEPEPDFTLKKDGKAIGVEETCYVDKRKIDKHKYYSDCEKITKKAFEKFSENKTQNEFHVTINYVPNVSIRYDPELVSEIASKVAELSIELELGQRIRWNPQNNNEEKLTNTINHIQIRNVTGKFKSFWSNTYSGWVPPLDIIRIEEIIREKEFKFKNHKLTYSEKWLLITKNKFNIATDYEFDDTLFHKKLTFTFDKVIIFDVATEETIYLK